MPETLFSRTTYQYCKYSHTSKLLVYLYNLCRNRDSQSFFLFLVPTAITDLTYISAVTSVLLSWKPPMVTNGDIQEYLIQYFSMGSAEPTTPAPSIDPSGMVNFSVEIFNDSKIMGEIFNDLQSELTLDKVENIMALCVYILTNETVLEVFQSDGSMGTVETDILQNYNLSNTIIDWFTNENQTVLQTCNSLQRAAEQKNLEDINKGTVYTIVTMLCYKKHI